MDTMLMMENVVVTGITVSSSLMSSMSRLPIACSTVPVQRKSSALENEWKTRIVSAAA